MLARTTLLRRSVVAVTSRMTTTTPAAASSSGSSSSTSSLTPASSSSSSASAASFAFASSSPYSTAVVSSSSSSSSSSSTSQSSASLSRQFARRTMSTSEAAMPASAQESIQAPSPTAVSTHASSLSQQRQADRDALDSLADERIVIDMQSPYFQLAPFHPHIVDAYLAELRTRYRRCIAETRRTARTPTPLFSRDGNVLRGKLGVLFVHKPAMLPVLPGGGKRFTLRRLLAAALPGLVDGERSLYPPFVPGMDESGVMPMSTSLKNVVKLRNYFRHGTRIRGARADALFQSAGVWPFDVRQVTVDLPIGRHAHGHPMLRSIEHPNHGGRRAVTVMTLIDEQEFMINGEKRWVCTIHASPSVGRVTDAEDAPHAGVVPDQVRLHAAAIGLPVVNDGKYGGARTFDQHALTEEVMADDKHALRLVHISSACRHPQLNSHVHQKLPAALYPSWADVSALQAASPAGRQLVMVPPLRTNNVEPHVWSRKLQSSSAMRRAMAAKDKVAAETAAAAAKAEAEAAALAKEEAEMEAEMAAEEAKAQEADADEKKEQEPATDADAEKE